jgi:two-component system sensor histidine kinase UhpB
LIRRLRPAVLDDMGLIAAVRTMGDNLLAPSGLTFALHVRGTPVPIPRPVETAVYRVFQEAGTNAVRHSGASHVHAGFAFEEGRLMGWFEDDGRGMDLAGLDGGIIDAGLRGHRWGLLGMRERLVQLGGALRFTHSAAGGLRIEIDVPLQGAT